MMTFSVTMLVAGIIAGVFCLVFDPFKNHIK